MIGKISSLASAVAVLAMASFPGQAGEQDPATCLQTAMTTPELTQCAGAMYLAAKNRMTEAYREVETHLDGATKKQKLQASQEAWEAYRNAYCNFVADGTGSLDSFSASLCSANLAADRSKELDGWPPLQHAGSRF